MLFAPLRVTCHGISAYPRPHFSPNPQLNWKNSFDNAPYVDKNRIVGAGVTWSWVRRTEKVRFLEGLKIVWIEIYPHFNSTSVHITGLCCTALTQRTSLADGQTDTVTVTINYTPAAFPAFRRNIRPIWCFFYLKKNEIRCNVVLLNLITLNREVALV